jgi:hypothetical protein
MPQFFLVKHTTVLGEYLTDSNPLTWGDYNDAVWTYDEESAEDLITDNNIEDAEVETFTEGGAPMDNEGGGAVAPTGKPPF